jgi:diamine N-acetyltransferase
MPMTVRVVSSGPSDANLLARIGETTFRETYSADTSAEEMDQYVAHAFARATIERELARPGSSFFVALVDGAPAGYLKTNTGDVQTELREKQGFEIESLYVLREFQGSGVGRRLLDCAIEEARRQGAEYVWLGVWERNEKARRFWEKQGFIEFGSHPFQFGDVGHTDLMLKRPIRGAPD